MSKNSVALPKSLIIFGICIPLALLVGYLLATPTDLMSFAAIGIVVLLLAIPLLLRWHYPALLVCWNANVTVFFLPGQPTLWMLLAGVSLFFTALACIMDKQIRFQNVRAITWPLVFLTLVILVTAKLTGGIGLRSLGGGVYGGKRLVFILAAIVGYYAISSQRIPIEKAARYTGLFFLSGMTGAVSNLIYLAGPAFYFLFIFFPVDNAISQAMEDFSTTGVDVHFGRLPGVTVAGMSVFYFMLSRYGIRGIMDVRRPWRILVMLVCFALSLLGGFRSAVIIFALICLAQFYFEGLFRSRLFLVLVIAFVLGGTGLVAFATKLPLSVQRSLTILPAIDLDPAARADAAASLGWRVEMWKILLPQVREYLWLGKGYALSPSDMYLVEESLRRGLAKDYEMALLVGDYHSGPLSILIPFGIAGLLGFLWLMVASIRLLYRNHRFSDPALQNINTFLLSYFVARAVFYFVGFGGFNSDLALFLGVVALSIALNGGVRDWTSLPAASTGNSTGKDDSVQPLTLR